VEMGDGVMWAAYTGSAAKRSVHQAVALGHSLDAFPPPASQFSIPSVVLRWLSDIAAKRLQEIEWA